MDQICRHLMGYRGRFQIPRLKFPISWCTCGYVPPQVFIHSLQSAALCKPLPCSILESCSRFSPQPTAIQTQAKHFAFLHTHTIHSTPLHNALSIILLLFHFSPLYLLISSKNIASRTLLNFITNKSEQKSKDKTDKHQIITMFHVNTLLVCLPSLSSAACHVANDKGQYITWQVLS